MYVDAYYNRDWDRIFIAERVNGQRVLYKRQVNHVLYYEHPTGSSRSIFGDACKKFSVTDRRKFMRELQRLQHDKKQPKIFESDINPIFRHLAENYSGAETPVLHVGFFDIEADFDPEKGFAPPDDPFNAVTAISVHLSHIDQLVTLLLCPPTLTSAEGEAIASQFPNTYLFDSEIDLLTSFLDIIEDCDVISGWNSEGYDIPYLVNRIERLISREETKRFCLWEQYPRKREYKKFGKTSWTYDLVGRVHLDYLVLYQKHNTQQLHSYRLDYVGEIEVGENKIPYEGTLDDLYKKDFYKFVEYNRQDTLLLVKIDRKRKFIELANQIAHSNCVLLKTTVGSVSLVEMAIINEMHTMGFVVPDRKPKADEGPKTKGSQKRAAERRVTREVDDWLVEERLHLMLEELTDEEKAAILADDPSSGPIEDDETALSVFAAWLRKYNPEALDAITEACTRDVVEDIAEVLYDGDDEDDGRTPVVGAYVAKPKKGLHSEVACIDINSLYPSCIRALNMSPETIIGQIRSDETMALVQTRIESGIPRAEAWDGVFATLEVTHMMEQDDAVLTIDFEDGVTKEMTGGELYEYIFTPENQVCITANGTIFRTDKDGIIPLLLAKWYSERKSMQAKEKMYAELAKGIEIDSELAALLAA